MKNIFENGRMVAIDGEEELDLGLCGVYMKSWRKCYMRKNSKHRASIRITINAADLSKDFWINHLQLFVNGKRVSSQRIRDEACDVLTRDIPEERHGDMYYYQLEEFTPTEKKKYPINREAYGKCM
jgi:hypothetical protein